MVTLVGNQPNFLDALIQLITLDYDAVEAYLAAIERIKNEAYKEKLKEFLKDHERHIQECSAAVIARGETPPKGPDMKQHLLKGKVIAAHIVGDNMILRAMKDNEIDTNTAYTRLNSHEGKWQEVVGILQRGLEDEKRHKLWLEQIVEA